MVLGWQLLAFNGSFADEARGGDGEGILKHVVVQVIAPVQH